MNHLLTVIISFILIIIFVIDNNVVINGASYGLMLWYDNVLPILLPFMLISGILANNINTIKSNINKEKLSILTTILLGVLCGYPLGAKTCVDFVQKNNYSKYVGNMILPLCNNISPMFLSGYIAHNILNNNTPLLTIILFIYTPYILLLLIRILFTKKSNNQCFNTDIHIQEKKSEHDYIFNSIIQITYVGVYIMICSIIIEFIYLIPTYLEPYRTFIAGITEITRGTLIVQQQKFNENLKTALILALTSFGGISSILQTNKVINKSGLSICQYVITKIICATLTFTMVILFI